MRVRGRSRLPGAIEEVLRFSPPVINFRRTALQDTEIRGTQIKAGDKIYLSYPSANRDEEVFEDSMRFDITREKNDHIAFGIGEHFCLGASLARMQLSAILGEILTRLPELRPTEAPRIQRSNFIHGITRMPVAFGASSPSRPWSATESSARKLAARVFSGIVPAQ